MSTVARTSAPVHVARAGVMLALAHQAGSGLTYMDGCVDACMDVCMHAYRHVSQCACTSVYGYAHGYKNVYAHARGS